MISEGFVADLHIHSRFSRATARNLDFEHIYMWAQRKGITVVGSGDFTHPDWYDQITEKLEPAEPGLLRLKQSIARDCDREVPNACRGPVRFMLSCEISNIYKKEGRTRKNHNLVFFPDMDAVRTFNSRLGAIGNIRSDGRPILGLDARDLLEIVLEVSEQGFLVPAHIWTPWFSMLGSKSGFDSLQACFGDLSGYIFAAETGLSSDPAMNWRVEELDRITLISNSDAHSPSKLGREANLFRTDLDYFAMRAALEAGDASQFLGTFEFYPEEGKYHVDGHRKCGVSFTPAETNAHRGICPECGKALTLGVLHRVEDLATRDEGIRPQRAFPFYRLIPLADLLAEIFRVGAQSKKVQQAYHALTAELGGELDILHAVGRDRIESAGVPLLGEAIERMRENRVSFDPGFDGRFGTVRIFSDRERERLLGQQRLFSSFEKRLESNDTPESPPSPCPRQAIQPEDERQACCHAPALQLNPEQQAVVDHQGDALMIIAGPGTGKTRTLTHKIARLIQGGADSRRILAVTFTNKAAEEMQARLLAVLPTGQPLPRMGTFHALGYRILADAMDEPSLSVADENTRKALVRDALVINNNAGRAGGITAEDVMDWISTAKQHLLSWEDPLESICPQRWVQACKNGYRTYQHLLRINALVDFEDLIFLSIRTLESDPQVRERHANRYRYLFVDEYQDINAGQYRLMRHLAADGAQICIIGDPDQSIYGFRGSDMDCFAWFDRDHPRSQTLFLHRNYRSTQTILDVASQVIRHNPQERSIGHRRRVYAEASGKRSIQVMEAATDRAEAVLIGKTIENMVGGTDFFSLDSGAADGTRMGGGFSFADFAVLSRTRGQANVIARTLANAGIPCQPADRQTTLAHPGIQSLLAALRLIHGIGMFADLLTVQGPLQAPLSAQALEIVKRWAFRNDLNVANTLIQSGRLPIAHLGRQRQQRLFDYSKKIGGWHEQMCGLSLAQKIEWIAGHSDLKKAFRDDSDFERGYQHLVMLAASNHADLPGFMASLALSSNTDMYDHRVEKVALMTMHAAKGLEFPVVFIAGCEDEWIPYRSSDKPSEMEEERRPFYVALTRAKRRLILTKANRRRIAGQIETRSWSPFVADIEDRRKHFSGQTWAKRTTSGQEQLSLF